MEALYVYESVQLEMTLLDSSTEEEQDPLTLEDVKLIKSITSFFIYFYKA